MSACSAGHPAPFAEPCNNSDTLEARAATSAITPFVGVPRPDDDAHLHRDAKGATMADTPMRRRWR